MSRSSPAKKGSPPSVPLARPSRSAYAIYRQEVRAIPRLSDAENRDLARRIQAAEALNAPLRAQNEAIRAENREIIKHNELVRFFAECKDRPFLAGLPAIERQARDPIPEIDERQHADQGGIDAMVRGNLWLPFHIVYRYGWRYEDTPVQPDDLLSAAIDALLLAVLHYKPDEAREFVSWTYRRILGAVREHFTTFRNPVPLPPEVRREHRRIMAAREALAQAEAGTAPARVIAATAGIPLGAFHRLEAQRVVMEELDAPLMDGDHTRADVLGVEDDEPDLDPIDPVRAAQLSVVRECLDALPPKPRRVVEMHFGLSTEIPMPAMSLWDIGLELGMDEKRVARALSTAMTTLRDAAIKRTSVEGIVCAA